VIFADVIGSTFGRQQISDVWKWSRVSVKTTLVRRRVSPMLKVGLSNTWRFNGEHVRAGWDCNSRYILGIKW